MRTLILGFDAFDPAVFERMAGDGRLPNLARHSEAGRYRRLRVANPPQSEVSWTSMATGSEPAWHGIFDFVHRNPEDYSLFLSLLPTQRKFGGLSFVPPSSALTLFDQAASRGYPAVTLWWPGSFPARPGSPVKTIPGLGTPDLLGRWGVGTQFTSDSAREDPDKKIPLVALYQLRKNVYKGILAGPIRKKRLGVSESAVEFEVEADHDSARITLGNLDIQLIPGSWSPIVELSFRFGPFVKVRALTRCIITSLRPHLELYFLPLQLHPLGSAWPYASPPGFVKRLWSTHGPFLTLGWPQDTAALEQGCINDDQFLDLCNQIFEKRCRILFDQLDEFEEGVLAVVLDTLDRVQHMFWRERPDIIEAWYEKLDQLLGVIERRLQESPAGGVKVLVLSDHGFADFDFKVHLNRWLIEKGYLSANGDSDRMTFDKVDWTKTSAYAIGLNSIYLNLRGRERLGYIEPGQVELVRKRLIEDLETWRGPDGNHVVRNAEPGPATVGGPDLVVGFERRYRASSETALGEWQPQMIERNRDHWTGDHCIDPSVVPGVLFSNHSLDNLSSPSYLDIPILALGENLPQGAFHPPPRQGEDDMEAVEERLRSLGYI